MFEVKQLNSSVKGDLVENIRRVKAKIEQIKRHRTDSQTLAKILSTSGTENKRERIITELFNLTESIKKISKKVADAKNLNPDSLFIVSEKTYLSRFGGEIEVPTPVEVDLALLYKRGVQHWALTGKPMRATYFLELQSRIAECVTKINSGSIDNALNMNVYEIAYQLMGLDGELLGKLSIDPFKGLTYQRFLEVELNERSITQKNMQNQRK